MNVQVPPVFDRINKTLICSVVFLDIVEYSRQPVSTQIQLKDAFNRLLSDALQNIAVNDRIIIDTGDGAAICFLGDPEDALFVAISLRDAVQHTQHEALPHFQVRIGINLGPAKVVRDINGQPNLLGDGINAAERIMSFAAPGTILVSRSFHEVVSCLSDEYAQLLQYDGSRTDKHVREHEVYQVGYGEIANRLTSPQKSSRARPGSPLHAKRALTRRQVVLGCLVLIGLGIAAYWVREDWLASPAAEPVAVATTPTIAAEKTPPSQPVANRPEKPVVSSEPSPALGTDANTSTGEQTVAKPPIATAKHVANNNHKAVKPVQAIDAAKAANQPPACPPSECWPNGRRKHDH